MIINHQGKKCLILKREGDMNIFWKLVCRHLEFPYFFHLTVRIPFHRGTGKRKEALCWSLIPEKGLTAIIRFESDPLFF
jgi:hypothetical protein